MLALVKQGKRIAAVVVGWILIAPIAASPTTELPHAIRTLVFLPMLQLSTSIGLITAYDLLNQTKKSIRYVLYIIFLVAASLNFVYFLSAYFIQQNHEYSKYWQYGYTQAVNYAKAHYADYDKIVVSIKLEQPHMFFLFNLKYDPALYLSQGGTASGGFAEIRNRFDKYEFREIHWEQEVKDGKTLYIGTPTEITSNILESIHYLDGSEAMRIAR
jgi:hypothetical protein